MNMRNAATLRYPMGNSTPLRLRFNLKLFWIFLFTSLAFFTAIYVFQVNEVARKTYLIDDYESKINQIQGENKNAQADFSKFSSMQDLENLARLSNFEPVGQVHYIRVLSDGVAAK